MRVERRMVALDGTAMTSRPTMQDHVLTALGIESVWAWDPDVLRDGVMAAQGAEIQWEHVAAARAHVGDEAVGFLLTCLQERALVHRTDPWSMENWTTLGWTDGPWEDPRFDTRRVFALDGAAMTTRGALQGQILVGFGLPWGKGWNEDGLWDDICWNTEPADVLWRNVALARAATGDETVDAVLGYFAERIAHESKNRDDPMTLVLEPDDNC